MSFEIVPATPKDIPMLVIVHQESFIVDPNTCAASHTKYSDQNLARIGYLRMFRDFFKDERYRVFKAVDTSSGFVAGHSVWQIPGGGSPGRSNPEDTRVKKDGKIGVDLDVGEEITVSSSSTARSHKRS